ncbi:hypothetical protein JCM16358_24430 [Halanaerocella petrolearia]
MSNKDPKQSKEEMEISQELDNRKTEEILEKIDADEKNERLKDPKQSTPNARSDLPKE